MTATHTLSTTHLGSYYKSGTKSINQGGRIHYWLGSLEVIRGHRMGRKCSVMKNEVCPMFYIFRELKSCSVLVTGLLLTGAPERFRKSFVPAVVKFFSERCR